VRRRTSGGPYLSCHAESGDGCLRTGACGLRGATKGCACDPGRMSLPQPGPQFENTYCVAAGKASSGPCPTDYPVTPPGAGGGLYYTGSSDQRVCTGCTCGAPTGATCANASIFTYNNSDVCDPATSSAPLAVTLACNATNNVLSAAFARATPTGGKSTPGGGQVQGTVQPTAPYAVCCTQ